MGLTNFTIQFENPLKVFFSGQVVTGQVSVELTDQKKFRSIRLELVGRGEVSWVEDSTDRNDDSRPLFYSNDERYVQQEVVLHHGPGLPSGVHVLPFREGFSHSPLLLDWTF